MSISKYFHKIVKHDHYFIDGLYINYSLPSEKMKNINYCFHSRDYIKHDIFKYNGLTQNNEPTPYPSKLEEENHPYWFVQKFLSFVKTSILSDLNDIKNNISEKRLNNILMAIKQVPQEKQFANSQGIKMGIGDHHNLQIQFDGKFFRGNNYQKDLKQLKNVGNRINEIFQMHFLQIPEWKKNEIAKIRPTIYQLHLAENLTKKGYQKCNLYKAKYPNSKKFEHKILKNPQVKQGAYVDITNNQSVTGFTHGFKGSFLCTVYNKALDTPEAKKHSIERFGNFRYWRREFQIGTKKLRACNVHYFANFLKDFKNDDYRAHIIRTIRKTADICVKGDNRIYLKFHDNSIRLKKYEKQSIENPLRFHKKPFIKLNIKTLPDKVISEIHWNPYKNLIGNLNSKHAKELTAEELIKINIKTILVMLENRRNSFVPGVSNNQQLIKMHDEGLELINNLKNYGKFFNVELHKSVPFNIDKFIAGS